MKTMLDIDELVFSPPELGCVLYLPGSPGGGSKIYDRSPYANHGAITGATWVRLPSGLWCLSFDGSDDKVDCGHDASLDPADLSFTFLVWARGDSDIANTGYIAQKGFSKYWNLRTSSKHPTMVLWDGAGAVDAQDNSIDVSDEVWHFYACVRDYGNDIYLYVDAGTPITRSDTRGSLSAPAQDLVLGNVSTAWWKGFIALPRIHNRALTALEIQTHFNREKHLFGVL